MHKFLQPLGALSSNNSIFIYDVPSQSELSEVVEVANGTANIEADFSLLGSQVRLQLGYTAHSFPDSYLQVGCLQERANRSWLSST